MTDYIKREDAILAITRKHDEVLSVADAIKDLDEISSADVVELEISPVCYKCDGKTAGVRTEKCLWLNGDNSKCIEQAHKLLYLAERKGMPSADVVEIKKEGEWDMFDLISSVWYGKGMYFKQDNGTVYSRHSGNYMTVDEAIREFISLIDI